MTFSKRVKSFLITFVSILGTAFASLVFSPQWSDFVAWLDVTGTDFATNHGIPNALVLVIGLFISEIWRQIINKYILEKRSVVGNSRHDAEHDLY